MWPGFRYLLLFEAINLLVQLADCQISVRWCYGEWLDSWTTPLNYVSNQTLYVTWFDRLHLFSSSALDVVSPPCLMLVIVLPSDSASDITASLCMTSNVTLPPKPPWTSLCLQALCWTLLFPHVCWVCCSPILLHYRCHSPHNLCREHRSPLCPCHWFRSPLWLCGGHHSPLRLHCGYHFGSRLSFSVLSDCQALAARWGVQEHQKFLVLVLVSCHVFCFYLKRINSCCTHIPLPSCLLGMCPIWHRQHCFFFFLKKKRHSTNRTRLFKTMN